MGQKMDSDQFEELCKKLQDPKESGLNLEYSIFDGDQSKIDRFVSLLQESDIKEIHLRKTGLDALGVAKLLKAMKDRGGGTTHVNIIEGFSNDEVLFIARYAGLGDLLTMLGGEQIRKGKRQNKQEKTTADQKEISSKEKQITPSQKDTAQKSDKKQESGNQIRSAVIQGKGQEPASF